MLQPQRSPDHGKADPLAGSCCDPFIEAGQGSARTESPAPPERPWILKISGQRLTREMNRDDHRLKVLFLCTGNSCRSQMAEGWAKKLRSEELDTYSAGLETHGLNPNAVKVMREAGVDISRQSSKNVKELLAIPFDYVITVCGHAQETCPTFPGRARVIHVGFDDPPALAANAKTEDEALAFYRQVRDQIRAFIETLPGSLPGRK